jgi:DNA-binding transcriptional LysR family regulator
MDHNEYLHQTPSHNSKTCYVQSMPSPDLNLLITLDALLTEGSVARAAQRLRLSPSAMSRALARLRETTGDPLLVRAGRGLVPTPRATDLRTQTSQLVHDAQAILRPTQNFKLKALVRTFTLRTREGFVETFGPKLISSANLQAPGVRLCFLPKTSKQPDALRNGTVDLETGVISPTTGPELRTQSLFQDRFIAVLRKDHSLTKARLTPTRYASGQHIVVSRRGLESSPIDEVLSTLKMKRHITTIVGTFSAALALAKASDLIATVPERQTGILRDGLHSMNLPFPTPTLTISMLWHPRMDADPAHTWLRKLVLKTCSSKTS